MQYSTLFSAANKPSRSSGCSGVVSVVSLSMTRPSARMVPFKRSATHSFSAQISASARVASCWSLPATQVQNDPPRFLECISSIPSSVRPDHQRSYALFHLKTSMKPTGSPSTPCMNGDSGTMLLPRRILAMAATHALVIVTNVACTGPCSRSNTHSGALPMIVVNSESRPNSSGFVGPSTLASVPNKIIPAVKKNSLPVSVGSRVTHSFKIRLTRLSNMISVDVSATRRKVMTGFGSASGSISSGSSSSSPPPPPPPVDGTPSPVASFLATSAGFGFGTDSPVARNCAAVALPLLARVVSADTAAAAATAAGSGAGLSALDGSTALEPGAPSVPPGMSEGSTGAPPVFFTSTSSAGTPSSLSVVSPSSGFFCGTRSEGGTPTSSGFGFGFVIPPRAIPLGTLPAVSAGPSSLRPAFLFGICLAFGLAPGSAGRGSGPL